MVPDAAVICVNQSTGRRSKFSPRSLVWILLATTKASVLALRSMISLLTIRRLPFSSTKSASRMWKIKKVLPAVAKTSFPGIFAKEKDGCRSPVPGIILLHDDQVFLLNEIGKRPDTDVSTFEREAYTTACGLALGIVNLGLGEKTNSTRDSKAADLADLLIEPNECAMLSRLFAQIGQWDPDVIVRHNGWGYDMEVLLTRCMDHKVRSWTWQLLMPCRDGCSAIHTCRPRYCSVKRRIR